MVHGSSAYFLERARFERRVSLFVVGVAAAALGVQIALLIPGVRARLARNDLIDPMRWGFEGPEQYVKRIILESSGRTGALDAPVVTYIPREALKGGGKRATSVERFASPVTRRVGVGPGDSPEELLTRARQLYRKAPVVQSEDLIIDRLVRPTYPQDAQDRHIGGRVAVMALVDTTGRVVHVDVMNSSGEGQIDRAATEAVWACRFLPYLHGGRVQEVYALFTFNFLPE